MGTLRTAAVTVDGVRSPVVETGPPESTEAVVFVHGNPGAARDWFDLLNRLPEGTRAVAPEMPGFGDADAPDDFEYTVQGYGRHLAGVLEQLRITRAHLVLHDFGGPWGLAFASNHPEAIGSITLMNTGALLDYRWHLFAKLWRTPVVGEVLMATGTRPTLTWAIGLQNKGLGKPELDLLYDQINKRGTKRAVLRLYRATPPTWMTEDERARLRALDPPVLVAWGTGDTYIPEIQAERQRETFPSARIERLEGVGHFSFMEDPDQVARVVLPFLAEQLAATPA